MRKGSCGKVWQLQAEMTADGCVDSWSAVISVMHMFYAYKIRRMILNVGLSHKVKFRNLIVLQMTFYVKKIHLVSKNDILCIVA